VAGLTGRSCRTGPTSITRRCWSGQCGWLKYGQRWYNPTVGRFTQQDSIERLTDPQQGNRYAYAADNPINYVDPTGESIEDLGEFASTVGNFSATGAFFGATIGCVVTLLAGCVEGAAAGAVIGGVVGGLFGIGYDLYEGYQEYGWF
jgi:RHS repeat-associated protein